MWNVLFLEWSHKWSWPTFNNWWFFNETAMLLMVNNFKIFLKSCCKIINTTSRVNNMKILASQRHCTYGSGPGVFSCNKCYISRCVLNNDPQTEYNDKSIAIYSYSKHIVTTSKTWQIQRMASQCNQFTEEISGRQSIKFDSAHNLDRSTEVTWSERKPNPNHLPAKYRIRFLVQTWPTHTFKTVKLK